MTVATAERLTLGVAARMIRDAMRDRSYQQTPLGRSVTAYLAWKAGEDGALPATITSYEKTLSKLALFYADLRPPDLDGHPGTDRIRAFWNHQWPANESSSSTRRTCLAHIRDYTKWLARERVISAEPCAHIRTPRRRDPVREGNFPTDDIPRILAANPRSRDQVALHVLFDLGVRRSALRLFQLGDYDAASASAAFHWKGDRRVELPVPAGLGQLLGEHCARRAALNPGWRGEYLMYPEHWGPSRDPDGPPLRLLWSRPDRPMTNTPLRNWWITCLDRAGVEYRKMHTARHTALTAFLRDTHNLKLTQLLAGHKSIQTTADIYAHLDHADLAAALEQMHRDHE